MVEQVIAGVVGGLCGALLVQADLKWFNAYCKVNDIEMSCGPAISYIIAAITGAYLFIQWFC